MVVFGERTNRAGTLPATTEETQIDKFGLIMEVLEHGWAQDNSEHHTRKPHTILELPAENVARQVPQK